MDLAAVRALVSGEGWGLLQSLPPYEESAALVLGDRLRAAGFAPELVAAALTQSRLRARAVDKFGEFAAGMLFTPDGLEQATRLPVAARHAARFRDAGVSHVLDLGCGIGGDAMAFAGVDLAVSAVEADEVTAAVAGVNLRHWDHAAVTVGRVEDVPLSGGEAARHTGAFLDPARRVPGVADARGRTRRLFSLEAISPSWETVRAVATGCPATAAKLSPSFPHAAVPAGAEAQWVSWQGEVVECVLWWGPLVRYAGRSACLLADGQAPVTLTQDDGPHTVPTATRATQVGPWLYEPDRAVVRAGLTAALTAAVGGVELAPGVGYVTTDLVVDVPFARRFAVVEAMPFNVKALRSWLRDRDVGRVTVKKRGVTLDSELLRRQLRLDGSVEATLVVTRVGSAQVVLVVQPH